MDLVRKIARDFNEPYLVENPREFHITLEYPFEEIGSIKEIEEFLEKILNLCKKLRKTKIQVDRLG